MVKTFIKGLGVNFSIMEGIIVNFRRGRKTVRSTHMIIEVEGVKNREEAKKLVGKKVLWVAPGKQKKEFKGEIRSAHGNKGVVRAIFDKGMPGQSVGTKVEVLK